MRDRPTRPERTKVHGNQKILFMPLELLDIFKEIDGKELETIVRRNTEWIKLTHGLLYYYGVGLIE